MVTGKVVICPCITMPSESPTMTNSTPADNAAVVRDFLQALAVPDIERAVALLGTDVEWRNTGLPTFRGKRVFGMLQDMERRRVGFGVEIHAIAAHGDVVLTDRTDYLWKGPIKTGFWVRKDSGMKNTTMSKDKMSKDGMSKDKMSKDGMKHDNMMKKDEMKK